MKLKVNNKVMLRSEEELRRIYLERGHEEREINDNICYASSMFNKVLTVIDNGLFLFPCKHGNEDLKNFYEYELILLKH